jgi:hypothetical protein
VHWCLGAGAQVQVHQFSTRAPAPKHQCTFAPKNLIWPSRVARTVPGRCCGRLPER